MPRFRKPLTYGLVLVAALLAVTLLAIHKRSEAYNYAVGDDYAYSFKHAAATRAEVTLHDGHLEIPLASTGTDAAFLQVRVRASLSGRLFNPRVRVAANGRESVLTLERGARGIRFVNLSGLTLTPGAVLQVSGEHLRIDDQAATLLVLHNGWATEQPRVLIISPHPDDGEIAAYGLYSRSNSYVVTLTAGEAGEARFFRAFPEPQTPFLEKGRVRVWNSVTVPLLGNVPADRVVNLGYFDGTLTSMYANRATPVTSQRSGASSLRTFRAPRESELLPPPGTGEATWEHLVSDLEYILDKVRPDIIVTPSPGIDSHPDHELATFAVIEALKNRDVHTGRLLLYTNHFTLSYMFPFGDRGESVSLPPSAAPPYFDGIYAPSLSADEQGHKLFALDAMIDLRPDTDWGSLPNASATLQAALRMKFSDSDNSYFRRAVRANELFFVVNVASLYDDTVLRAVETRPAAH